MAEHQHSTPNLPRREEQIDHRQLRKSLRTPMQEMGDTLKSQGTIKWVMLSSAAAMVVLPQGWMAILPAAASYYVWATGSQFRLPFRGPASWGGEDYSAPKPGKPGRYENSDGILYLGTDQGSKEELWITNSDARRHGFILGTTGSGKAFPVWTPVLTKRGWILIGDLKEGDEILHPSGDTVKIHSVHPQGVISAVRMWFDDGRHIECSPDHLWTVDVNSPIETLKSERRTMKAQDLGILVNAYNGIEMPKVDVRLPDMSPPAFDLEFEGEMEAMGRLAAKKGFEALPFRPSLRGTAEQRRAFIKAWFEAGGFSLSQSTDPEKGVVRIAGLDANDARELKRIVWSLGGRAATWSAPSVIGKRSKPLARRLMEAAGKEIKRISGRESEKLALTLSFKGMGEVFNIPDADPEIKPPALIGVEALDSSAEMVCIKTDREDGLFIVDGYLVTHNTELLLGIVSQSIMWSSGFLFIDGKGTPPFYKRIWGLARRFGREDDLRVMNFTDSGGGVDPVPGGPGVQSNTANPFAKGDSDQLMNILVSIMGDAGKGNDMWAQRASSLVTAAMKALVEMRDRGEITFNVQVLREYLALGKGTAEHLMNEGGGGGARKMGGVQPAAAPVTIDTIPEKAWHEMRTRPGLIELYLRAMNGEFSDAATKALAGFFTSLPGFSLETAIKGKPQPEKANEQYNFLFMQLTKPLSTFADSFAHIFMTSFGEVDLEDVMLNRRILIVLLPALQKAKAEMQNCGKVVVALVKIMMGKASDVELAGSRKDTLDSSPTNSMSPFIVVLDEVGYYMVDGIDVMMAQARSLGFMVILAGQDMAAMQAVSKELSEIAAANASLFASGKCVDGGRTIEFISKLFGKVKVSQWRNYERIQGDFGMRTVNSRDITFEEVDSVSFKELNGLQPGEFYYKFDKEISRTNTLYIGEDYPDIFSVNKFLKVMGPMDRMPGLNQEEDLRFFGQFSDFCRRFISGEVRMVAPPNDTVTRATDVYKSVYSSLPAAHQKKPAAHLKAYAAGILSAGSLNGSDLGEIEIEGGQFDDNDPYGEFDFEEANRGIVAGAPRSTARGMLDLLLAEREAARKTGVVPRVTQEENSTFAMLDRIARSQEAFHSLLLSNTDDDVASVGALRNNGLINTALPDDAIATHGAAAMGALEALASKKKVA